MASRSPTRAAWAASISPTVASRYGLPSSEGSMARPHGPHASTLDGGAFTARAPMWKMGSHEVPGRAAGVPAPHRGRDPTHGVGDSRDAHGQVPRVPAGAGPAAGRGTAARASAPAERDRGRTGGDRRAAGGGGRRLLPLRRERVRLVVPSRVPPGGPAAGASPEDGHPGSAVARRPRLGSAASRPGSGAPGAEAAAGGGDGGRKSVV